jgi:Spy/CpxP family protein refolding chaperone
LKRYIALPLLLVLFAAASANAGQGCGHGHGVWEWWDNEEITQKINLTEAQAGELQRIYESYKPRLEELGNTYKEKREAFHNVMSNPEADRGAVLSTFDAKSDAGYNAHKAKIEMKLDMRQVLTPDQINGVNDIVKSWREQHHKK